MLLQRTLFKSYNQHQAAARATTATLKHSTANATTYASSHHKDFALLHPPHLKHTWLCRDSIQHSVPRKDAAQSSHGSSPNGGELPLQAPAYRVSELACGCELTEGLYKADEATTWYLHASTMMHALPQLDALTCLRGRRRRGALKVAIGGAPIRREVGDVL